MRSMSRALCFSLILSVTAPTHAATFTVGNNWIGCTHRSLTDAVAAAAANGPGADSIRINSNYAGLGMALSIVGHSVRLTGGHSSCLATTPNATSTLNAAPGRRAITIAAYPDRRTSVELRNLVLTNGTPSDAGGGLAVFGNVAVVVRNSRVAANRADRGGGVYVDGMSMAIPTEVQFDNSLIQSNFARLQGGGVFCRGDARISVRGGSRILNNGYDSSNALVDRGGGAFVEDCNWHQVGGAISSNRARIEGAGLLARDGAVVLMEWGNSSDASPQPILQANQVGSELNVGSGGAITAKDAGTQVELFGTALYYNHGSYGAAISVRGGASLSMQRDPRCQSLPSYCSDIVRNDALGVIPSVVEITDGSTVSIAQTRLVGNTAVGSGTSRGSVFELFNSDLASTARLMLHSTAIISNSARNLISLFGSEFGQASEQVDAQFLTLSNNSIDSVLRSGSGSSPSARISLRASIIDELEPLRNTPAGADDSYDCLLSRAALSVAATRSLIADPMLDVSLMPQVGSPALDFCSGENLVLDRGDLRNSARAVDLIGLPNRFGAIDVGAIELTTLVPAPLH